MSNKYRALRVDKNITESIDNWIEHGFHPGSCTELLLRGEYKEAWYHAHPMIKPHWIDHVTYVKTCVPDYCKGKNFDKWRGMEYYNCRTDIDPKNEVFEL